MCVSSSVTEIIFGEIFEIVAIKGKIAIFDKILKFFLKRSEKWQTLMGILKLRKKVKEITYWVKIAKFLKNSENPIFEQFSIKKRLYSCLCERYDEIQKIFVFLKKRLFST